MKNMLLNTTAMVPIQCQQWQADTSQQASTTDAAGATQEVPDDFSSIFDALSAGGEPEAKKDGDGKEGGQGTGGDGAAIGDAASGDGGAGAGADGKGAAATGDGAGSEGADDGGTGDGADDGLPDPAKVAAEAAAAAEAAKAGKVEGQTDKPQEKSLEQVMRELLTERQQQQPAQQGETAEQKTAREAAEAEQRRQQTTAIYSKEEQGLIDAYQQAFPEVAVAEELKRREEYKIFAASIFNFIDQKYGPAIAALSQFAGGVQTETHQTKLATLIPDYAEVRQPVLDWIGQQPANLKAGFEKVAKEGTAEEIKDVVDFWRLVSGKAAPQAATTAQPAADGQQRQSSQGRGASAAQRIKEALRAPQGKRGNTGEGLVDPNSFDDGFKAAAEMEM